MARQTPGIGADVQLHLEMPLVPLPRPVHLRIAGVALVPGVDDDAETMVASTMLPSFSRTLRSARRSPISRTAGVPVPRRSSRRRKSGSSSRPAPSPDSPRQGAGRSRSRKHVLHRRVARIAERLHAVHAQHRRQRMRLSPLPPPLGQTGAMWTSRRAPGIGPSIRSGKISRCVLRFQRTRQIEMGCPEPSRIDPTEFVLAVLAPKRLRLGIPRRDHMALMGIAPLMPSLVSQPRPGISVNAKMLSPTVAWIGRNPLLRLKTTPSTIMLRLQPPGPHQAWHILTPWNSLQAPLPHTHPVSA